MRYDDADWIYLAQDREKWKAFVKTIMKIRVLYRKLGISSQTEFTYNRVQCFVTGVTLLGWPTVTFKSESLLTRGLYSDTSANEDNSFREHIR